MALIWFYIKDPDYLERRKAGDAVDYLGLALLSLGLGCQRQGQGAQGQQRAQVRGAEVSHGGVPCRCGVRAILARPRTMVCAI